MSEMLSAALDYAGRGWPVVPIHGLHRGTCSCFLKEKCPQPLKHPASKNGLTDAGSDRRVTTWYHDRPFLNVGICTGSRSFIVLDIDPDHGGEESIRAMQKRYGRLPDTVEAITGGGGRHLCFRPPAGISIRNKQGWADFPGVDVRGDGGYIVAPPSLHRSGRRYEWEASSHPDDVELAPLPDWAVELLTTGNKQPEGAAGYQNAVTGLLKPLAPIWKGCTWLRHTRADAAKLGEGEWYAMLTVLSRLQDGMRLAHEWSRPHRGYDPAATEEKVGHAVNDTGPATCRAIQTQWGGGRHCIGCFHAGKIASPVSLANLKLLDLEQHAPPPRKGER